MVANNLENEKIHSCTLSGRSSTEASLRPQSKSQNGPASHSLLLSQKSKLSSILQMTQVFVQLLEYDVVLQTSRTYSKTVYQMLTTFELSSVSALCTLKKL